MLIELNIKVLVVIQYTIFISHKFNVNIFRK